MAARAGLARGGTVGAGARHRRQYAIFSHRLGRPAAAPTLRRTPTAGHGLAGHAGARRTRARLGVAGPLRRVAAPATAFEHLAAVRGWMPNLTGIDEPERLRGAAVSHGYFAALGVRTDARTTSSPRTTTSRAVRPWPSSATRCGRDCSTADPGLVGRTILLDGQADDRRRHHAGVVPSRRSSTPTSGRPIRIDPARAPRGMIVLRVHGQAEAGGHPGAGPGRHVRPSRSSSSATIRNGSGHASPSMPLHDDLVGNVRQMLLVLAAAVALVLLISCANVMQPAARARGRPRARDDDPHRARRRPLARSCGSS